MIGCKVPKDEVMVAEERSGWMRLSEFDDWWGMELAKATGDEADDAPRAEAWMLVHGAEVGLGVLLEEVQLHGTSEHPT